MQHKAKPPYPANDWFFETFADQEPRTSRQVAVNRGGTAIVLITLTLVIVFILTGVM